MGSARPSGVWLGPAREELDMLRSNTDLICSYSDTVTGPGFENSNLWIKLLNQIRNHPLALAFCNYSQVILSCLFLYAVKVFTDQFEI
jgi:hypothetical protein